MIISAAKALALCRIGFGLYYLSYAFDKTRRAGSPMPARW